MSYLLVILFYIKSKILCINIWNFFSHVKVDIFFRRALFQSEQDQNERIFCLMNADKLQYDASEQSLKDVTEYIKSAKGGKILFLYYNY